MLCIGLIVNLGLDNTKAFKKKILQYSKPSFLCRRGLLPGPFRIQFICRKLPYFLQYFHSAYFSVFPLSMQCLKKIQTQIPKILASMDFNEKVFSCFCGICLFVYGKGLLGVFLNYLRNWSQKKNVSEKLVPVYRYLATW